jgi:hypothetical protein
MSILPFHSVHLCFKRLSCPFCRLILFTGRTFVFFHVFSCPFSFLFGSQDADAVVSRVLRRQRRATDDAYDPADVGDNDAIDAALFYGRRGHKTLDFDTDDDTDATTASDDSFYLSDDDAAFAGADVAGAAVAAEGDVDGDSRKITSRARRRLLKAERRESEREDRARRRFTARLTAVLKEDHTNAAAKTQALNSAAAKTQALTLLRARGGDGDAAADGKNANSKTDSGKNADGNGGSGGSGEGGESDIGVASARRRLSTASLVSDAAAARAMVEVSSITHDASVTFASVMFASVMFASVTFAFVMFASVTFASVMFASVNNCLPLPTIGRSGGSRYG